LKRVDVIIVGGGPAGLSTGLHLLQQEAGWAKRVLLLEKARYPRHKLCGGGITWYGEAVLKGLGLAVDEVPGVTLNEMELVLGGSRVSFHGSPVGRVVRRDEFDAWLASKAIERGLEVHTGEPLTGVTAHEGGVTVETPEGRYEARALVAADGSHGGVRRKLGVEDKARLARLLEILTPVEDEASRRLHAERRAVFDFEHTGNGLQGYYWDFPCVVNGEPCINRGIFDARIVPDEPLVDLKRLLRRSLAARGLNVDRCELMGHPIRCFDRDAVLSVPHVLFAGDAAGADPLMGEGISFALAYGGLAADTLRDAFARDDFRFADYRERLLGAPFGQSLLLRSVWAGLLYKIRSVPGGKLILRATKLGVSLLPSLAPYRAGWEGPVSAGGWGFWRRV
jgi:flavin-dependent dehydrogenase